MFSRRTGLITQSWLGGFLLLSLGAHPRVLGREYDGITLPHALFEGAPLLAMFRVANRFALVATLGLAVLAGSALAALFLFATVVCVERKKAG